MMAAKAGAIEIVEMLLRHGAISRECDENGRTALHWAAIGGDFPEIAAVLIGAGVNPSIRSQNGESSLDYAVAMNRSELIVLLGA